MNSKTILIFLALGIVSCGTTGRKVNKVALSQYLVSGSNYYFDENERHSALKIKHVSDTDFGFVIDATNGGNAGKVSGVAKVANDTSAIYALKSFKLVFVVTGKSSVMITQEGSYNAGLGVNYEGRYLKKDNNIVVANGYGNTVADDAHKHLPFLSKEINDDLIAKSGGAFKDIVACMQEYTTDTVKEDTISYTIFSGFVEGLGSIYESIILSRSNKFYFAGVVKDDTVRLYSNDPIYTNDKNKMPGGVKQWIDKVDHQIVLFKY